MPHIPGAKFPYEGQPPEGIEPGTFGCHEALQLARSRAPDRNGGRELRLCASLLRRMAQHHSTFWTLIEFLRPQILSILHLPRYPAWCSATPQTSQGGSSNGASCR